jgi:ribosomal protein L37AE/L43A
MEDDDDGLWICDGCGERTDNINRAEKDLWLCDECFEEWIAVGRHFCR